MFLILYWILRYGNVNEAWLLLILRHSTTFTMLCTAEPTPKARISAVWMNRTLKLRCDIVLSGWAFESGAFPLTCHSGLDFVMLKSLLSSCVRDHPIGPTLEPHLSNGLTKANIGSPTHTGVEYLSGMPNAETPAFQESRQTGSQLQPKVFPPRYIQGSLSILELPFRAPAIMRKSEKKRWAPRSMENHDATAHLAPFGDWVKYRSKIWGISPKSR